MQEDAFPDAVAFNWVRLVLLSEQCWEKSLSSYILLYIVHFR